MALCKPCKEAGDLMPMARKSEVVKNLVLGLWETCEPGCMNQKVWADSPNDLYLEAVASQLG